MRSPYQYFRLIPLTWKMQCSSTHPVFFPTCFWVNLTMAEKATSSFPGSWAGKESTCKAGDPSSICGSGRSSGEGIGYPLQYSWASLVAQMVKNLPQYRKPGLDPWIGKIPWRAWQPTPVFLPGESGRDGILLGMDRRAWQATTFSVAKSQKRMSN